MDIGGLRLVPRNYKWFANRLKFRIAETAVFSDVHKVLAGIIHSNQLQELHEVGTAIPVALAIFRLYIYFHGSFQSQPYHDYLLQHCDYLLQHCAAEAPAFGKGNPMTRFYQLAARSMDKVDVRLDEYGKSTCKGPAAVRLVLLIPEIVSESIARIWLLDGLALFFLELSMEELTEISSRIRFMDQEVWKESDAIEKEIMYAGKLITGAGMWSIRHAEPSRCNIASKRVLWAAVRSHERETHARISSIIAFNSSICGDH